MKRITTALAFLTAFTTAVLAQDFEEGLKAANSGDFATALQEWEQLAEQGNVTAQYYLGKMYRRGLGGVQDNAKAVKWHVEAAEQGLAAAQNDLGSIYKNGLIVTQDYAEAIKWYRKAAD
ncbi:tetratricopeptide repeat protein [Pseudopelagicola sp. nBUS_19]|uniref:tetratricopeptide repeat protein n=1 Tax=Pseudopelagicola sp. nBUS_19 TaxID=3395316 RepID=UPI003EBA8E0D